MLATLGVVLFAAGCGDEVTNPIKPSRNTVSIRGIVTDRPGRPLAGALVEVLSGPRAGLKTLSDGAGRFELRSVSASNPELTGIAEGAVTLRASHSGFQSRTLEDFWLFDISDLPSHSRSERVIWLDAGPTIGLEPGAYTLTTTIDLATARDWLSRAPCRGFPADLASRSFHATIDLRDRALDLHSVSVENRPRGSGFWLSRVGRFILFEVEDGFSGLFEDLPGFRYLMIGGVAPTSEPPIDTGTSVSIPFFGTFQVLPIEVCARHRQQLRASAARTDRGLSRVRVGRLDDDLYEALSSRSESIRARWQDWILAHGCLGRQNEVAHKAG